jgi:hypothetical protein
MAVDGGKRRAGQGGEGGLLLFTSWTDIIFEMRCGESNGENFGA